MNSTGDTKSQDWLIHAIIAAVVVGAVALIFLFAYLPRIAFDKSETTTMRGSENGSSYDCTIDGRHLITLVLSDRVRAASSWKPFAGPPPVPIDRALDLARGAFASLGVRVADWRVESVTFEDTSHDQKFYYAIRFVRPDPKAPYPWESFVVAVLLDGSTVLPH